MRVFWSPYIRLIGLYFCLYNNGYFSIDLSRISWLWRFRVPLGSAYLLLFWDQTCGKINGFLNNPLLFKIYVIIWFILDCPILNLWLLRWIEAEHEDLISYEIWERPIWKLVKALDYNFTIIALLFPNNLFSSSWDIPYRVAKKIQNFYDLSILFLMDILITHMSLQIYGIQHPLQYILAS